VVSLLKRNRKLAEQTLKQKIASKTAFNEKVAENQFQGIIISVLKKYLCYHALVTDK